MQCCLSTRSLLPDLVQCRLIKKKKNFFFVIFQLNFFDMLNDIKALDTHSLLEFLNKHNERLHLDNEDFDILKNNKVSDCKFQL